MQLSARFSQNRPTTQQNMKSSIFFSADGADSLQATCRWPHLSPQAIIFYPPHASPEFSQIDVYYK